MAQWGKGLLCKHQVLSSDPSTHTKIQMWWSICNLSIMKAEAGRSLGLAAYQPNSRFSERACLKRIRHRVGCWVRGEEGQLSPEAQEEGVHEVAFYGVGVTGAKVLWQERGCIFVRQKEDLT